MGAEVRVKGIMRYGIAGAIGVASSMLMISGLGLGFIAGGLIGLTLFGLVSVALAPEGTFDPRRRNRSRPDMPERVRDELNQAKERVKTIRRLAYAQGTDPMRESLLSITDTTKDIIADVEREPGDHRRMRKALTHYLSHVETIAERIDYVRKTGGSEPEVVERSRGTLKELADVFQSYRDKMLDDEVFDVDARIDLLENEIRAEAARRSTTTQKSSRST